MTYRTPELANWKRLMVDRIKQREKVMNALTVVNVCPLEVSFRTRLPCHEVEKALIFLVEQGKIKKHTNQTYSLIDRAKRLKDVI